MSEGQAKKVFLVEDNMEISRMYERAFRLRGHQVELAYDGETAFQKLKDIESVPDAIILDVRIPHMNGVDLMREIKKEPKLAHVPVVILTNSFHKHDRDIFLDLGADLYLVKIEHQAKQIVEEIEALIEKHKAQHE